MTSTVHPVHPVLHDSLGLLRMATTGLTGGDVGLRTPCSAWTVGQVLRHAAGDQQAWAMAVGNADGPGFDPFDPPAGDDDPSDLVAQALGAAQTVWATVPVDGGPVPTPLPQGPMSADAAARACALDAAVHSWDVMVALGRPSPLGDDLAAELLLVAREIVEPLRQYGVFAEALPPEPGDGPAAELLRYLGRDPLWTA